VKLSRVGYPLVDQNKAGRELVEQLLHLVAGVGGLLVVGADHLVTGLAAQLPGDLAPDRSDDGPVVLRARVAGRHLGADYNGASDLGSHFASGFLQDLLGAGKFGRGCAGEKMVKRQHAVGFAAAEIRLQLDHRVAALPADAAYAVAEELLQSLGDEGAPEELGGVLVLGCRLAQVHLPQIGRELRLLVFAAGHVPVRGDNFAPWLEAALRVALGGGHGVLAHLAPALLVETHA